MTEGLLTRAAHDLIAPWNEIITRDSGKWEATDPLDPLLVTLDELVASNSGAGIGGSLSSTRNLVNMSAFKLREKIHEYANRWEPATGVKISRKLPLRASIQHAVTRAELLYQSGQMLEEHYSLMISDCDRWKREIHDLIDPPRVKEISAPCPRCETAFVLSQNEDDGGDIREPALTISYRSGSRAPANARCGYCGAQWTGEDELKILAGLVGANTDYDTLREMGLGE